MPLTTASSASPIRVPWERIGNLFSRNTSCNVDDAYDGSRLTVGGVRDRVHGPSWDWEQGVYRGNQPGCEVRGCRGSSIRSSSSLTHTPVSVKSTFPGIS